LGQDKSALCAQCHGRNGISIVPIYPNLAGQKEQYLVLSLKAYRSGERVNMAMTPHARKLSDEDIADLAAYYAQMDPRGGQPSVDEVQ
jgi:cytochrome c553